MVIILARAKELDIADKKAEAIKKRNDARELKKKKDADDEALRLKTLNDAQEAASKAELERIEKEDKAREKLIAKLDLQAWKLGIMSEAATAFGALTSQLTENRIAEIDRELQAELEANGLAEDSKISKLETELLKAKETGDQELIDDAQKNLEKGKIVEKYEKKKAQAEYEGQLWAYGINITNATLQGAMATLNAFTSTLAIPIVGPALAPGAAIAAGAISGLMVAATALNKPQAPSFAVGTARVDRDMVANVHKDEIILPKGISDTARQEGINITPKGGDGPGDIVYQTQSKEELYRIQIDDAKNGVFILPDVAIVKT